MDIGHTWSIFHLRVFSYVPIHRWLFCKMDILHALNIKKDETDNFYTFTFNVYLSGNAFPHILQWTGCTAVWSFWTWSRRSVFLPHVVGHNSHWNTGLSPVWIRRCAFNELLCLRNIKRRIENTFFDYRIDFGKVFSLPINCIYYWKRSLPG